MHDYDDVVGLIENNWSKKIIDRKRLANNILLKMRDRIEANKKKYLLLSKAVSLDAFVLTDFY